MGGLILGRTHVEFTCSGARNHLGIEVEHLGGTF